MKCPKCKNSLLQKTAGGDTKVRLKGRIVLAKAGGCDAQCFWCGEAVHVPLELRKADPPKTRERFILRNAAGVQKVP